MVGQQKVVSSILNGERIKYKIKPYLPKGWFGVNYEGQSYELFQNFRRSEKCAAMAMLYTFGILEMLTRAFVFSTLSYGSYYPKNEKKK